MVTTSPYFEAARRLRAFVRAHETSLVVLAALVGTVGGLVVAAMSAAVEGLHVVLFNLQIQRRRRFGPRDAALCGGIRQRRREAVGDI
jgi:CIC family chloride channel protein